MGEATLTLKNVGFWDVFFFGEMQFVLSNFLSNEDLSTVFPHIVSALE